MVTKRNLPDIVRILMEHVTTAEGGFRHELVSKIVEARHRPHPTQQTGPLSGQAPERGDPARSHTLRKGRHVPVHSPRHTL
jgi:hypothetical protein